MHNEYVHVKLFQYIEEINHGSHNVLGVLTWIGGYYYFIPRQKRRKTFTNTR
jgi:hypothetical protein